MQDQTMRLHDVFERRVACAPEAIAFECNGVSYSYRELNERANRLAHYLATFKVGPEVRVGLFLDRTLETVVGIIGVLKAGGAYVPIDPSYPTGRIANMIEDAAVELVLTTRACAAELPSTTKKIVELDTIASTIDGLASGNPVVAGSADDLAYIIFTSGSTGRPKGVMVTHHNVVRLFQQTQPWFGFDENDVWSLFHSYAFDFSVWEIWGALLYGGRVVMVPSDVAWSPEAFHQFVIDRKITVLNQTPSYFQRLLQVDAARIESARFALRYVIFGGEALNVPALAPWFDRHGDERPKLVNMFGITETTVHVTYRPLRAADVRSASSPIGIPIPDLTVRVLDDALNEVPDGQAGELYVGGEGVARGYVNRPELTATRFIRDPFSDDPSARLYKTGDLGRRVGNDLEHLGRADHQVKIRGFRIELGEIEAVIAQHAAVGQCLVVMGETSTQEKQLIAYVTPRQRGASIPLREVRALAQRLLPAYMVPSVFVPLPEFGLTANGKVDRTSLPRATQVREQLGGEAVPPRDDLEAALVAIWEDELGVQPVGVTDDFFELGGHSLLAVRVAGRVARLRGETLPLAALVQNPTIESLATLLRTRTKGAATTPLVALHKGSKPPLFFVHPIGGNVFCYAELARRLGDDQAVYGLEQQGLDGGAPIIADVVSQATSYLSAIRTVQPKGPYFLGGWSYGGIVAYEIAHQLQQQGDEVRLLALLDSRATTSSSRVEAREKTGNFDLATMAYWFTVVMRRIVGVETKSTLADFQGLDDDARVRRIAEELAPSAEAAELAQLGFAFRAYVNNMRALIEYDTPTYTGPMTLLRAVIPIERLPGRPTPPPWSWDEYCARIETHDILNNHFTMLGADKISLVAEPLLRALRRAQGAGR